MSPNEPVDAAGAMRLVQTAEPDLALACGLGPAGAHPALFALAAFHHELAKTPEVTSERITAQIRLQWWREAVEAAADPAAPVPAHEVATPLGAAIRAGQLPAPPLLAMIEARAVDLEALPHNSLSQMDTSLVAYLGALLSALTAATGTTVTAETSTSLARGYGRIGLIRAFPLHWRQRRTWLATGLFAEHGVSQAALFDQRPGDGHRAAFAALGAPALAVLTDLHLPRTRAALPLEALRRLGLHHGRRLERVGWDHTRVAPVRLPPTVVAGLMLSRWTRR